MYTKVVIYRTGGTANFQWQCLHDRFTAQGAIVKRDELLRMGYPALIHEDARLRSIGLPETYEA